MMDSEVVGLVDLVAASVGALFILYATLRWLTKTGPRFGRHITQTGAVADDPDQAPYCVYTHQFDLVQPGATAHETLRTDSLDRSKGWLGKEQHLWSTSIATVEAKLDDEPYRRRRDVEYRAIFDACGNAADEVFLTFLVDQSGSMKGSLIEQVTLAVVTSAASLTKLGAKVEVLGFTTAGWHGGLAYEQWRFGGQPPRPGRLCALRHIIYKTADETEFQRASWCNLLNPDLLRENIDGEAIAWAWERMRGRPEPRKLLIIVSDGAPVDDATLLHNGPGYLLRHLDATMRNLRAERNLTLGTLRLQYEADEGHGLSIHVPEIRQIADYFFALTRSVIAEAYHSKAGTRR